MNKKFKVIVGIITIITLFIGIMTFSNKAYAEDIDQSKKILKELLDGDYESIKRIEFDENGNIKYISDVTNNKVKSALEDGLYAIDRKDGWIRGRDAGFLRSIIIPSGAQGGLQQISYIESVTTKSKESTISFGIDFIKTSLNQAFGEGIGEGKEITVKNFITAPEGKDIFLKAQTVYRKYELIRISGGKVIDHGTQYKPTGYASSKIEYNSGTKVDQKQLYEKIDRNILGSPDYAIHELPEFVADNVMEYNFPNKDQSYVSTSFIPQQNSVGIYFTVPSDGRYELREKFMPSSSADISVGIGANMTLYKVKKENNKILEVIDSKPYDFIEYNKYVGYIGPQLIGNLRADEKYLLSINSNNISYWPDVNNRKVKYSIELKKSK